jgi:hypothetical protein
MVKTIVGSVAVDSHSNFGDFVPDQIGIALGLGTSLTQLEGFLNRVESNLVLHSAIPSALHRRRSLIARQSPENPDQ